MTSEVPADVSSLFSKKKGKKGKKGYNLNLDSVAPKAEETPKIAILNDLLGGVDQPEDDGWADVVEKKNVVVTGGKKVAELIDMSALMVEDESTRSKLEKQDIKQAFHDARTVKERDTTKGDGDEKDKGADSGKGNSLSSGNAFGGGANGPALHWKVRMQERQLKQREQELSVDNVAAFPSLADAMSGPPKQKQSSKPEGNPWVRRTGGLAAAATIKAALGRDDERKPTNSLPPAPTSSTPAAAAKAPATQRSDTSPRPNAAPPIWVRSPQEETSSSSPKTDKIGAEPEAESVPAAKIQTKSDQIDNGAVHTEPAAVETATVEAGPDGEETVLASKEALVQQFGKKKKKKKKPADVPASSGET